MPDFELVDAGSSICGSIATAPVAVILALLKRKREYKEMATNATILMIPGRYTWAAPVDQKYFCKLLSPRLRLKHSVSQTIRNL